MEDYMLPCSNKALFGVECMGCGIQRSIALLLQGKFVEAFYMYPAIYPLILLLIIIFINFIDKKRKYHKILIILSIFTGITIIVSYFYKQFYR
ncbi:MAG: DUF2752 domain-containing protein [Capnocytophaga sp.]|nr:DUF2752 domain-containing protein [Capnocytophaga sp.]